MRVALEPRTLDLHADKPAQIGWYACLCMIVGMNFLPTGRLLRMRRIRRGWRQDDVSGKSGLSPAAISRHELGRRTSRRLVERVSRAASACRLGCIVRAISRHMSRSQRTHPSRPGSVVSSRIARDGD